MAIIPFDKREGFIWYNGEIVPWGDVQTHILNHSLHYGGSVFEGEAVYDGKIFKSREHSERFLESARLLDFEIPYSVEELMEAKDEIVKKQNVKNGYVRPFAWRGAENLLVSSLKNTIHTAIATWTWPPYYSADARIEGIKMVFAKYKRPSPETAPVAAKAAGLYVICTISKHEAEKAGYNEALMLDYRGYIAEACSANIFFIMNDEIHTPLPDCFLNGITRQTVIQIARDKGLKVHERHIKPEEIENAQDAFLTGTAAEVTRIKQIDNNENSFTHKTSPHPITLALIEDYHNLVSS